MTRPIKFRVFDKNKKEMRIVDSINFMFESEDGLQVDVIGNDDPGEYKESLFPEDFEIMQFTGLYDKNGKEIYEGDIVKTGIHIGEIIFRKGWQFQSKFENKIIWFNLNTRNTVFVLQGNIHEHPHLLEKK